MGEFGGWILAMVTGMARDQFTSPPSIDPTRRVIVDVTGLADELGVNVSFVRRLVWERRIPYFKIGKLIRFDLAEVHDWLDQRRVDALR
jgi:excisionase family DNA binding protein